MIKGLWIYSPFILQALLIFIDEWIFHLKRALPKWERLGHPLDTLSVLICFLWVLWTPYSPHTLKIYLALALFSTFFITKDEWVHKECCPKTELWLHALLFINHPILLGALACLWIHQVQPLAFLGISSASSMIFFKLQSLFIFLFMLYQIIYWNFLWKEKKNS